MGITNEIKPIAQYLGQARGYDQPLSLLGGQTLKEAGLAIYGLEIEPHNINFGEEGRP